MLLGHIHFFSCLCTSEVKLCLMANLGDKLFPEFRWYRERMSWSCLRTCSREWGPDRRPLGHCLPHSAHPQLSQDSPFLIISAVIYPITKAETKPFLLTHTPPISEGYEMDFPRSTSQVHQPVYFSPSLPPRHLPHKPLISLLPDLLASKLTSNEPFPLHKASRVVSWHVTSHFTATNLMWSPCWDLRGPTKAPLTLSCPGSLPTGSALFTTCTLHAWLFTWLDPSYVSRVILNVPSPHKLSLRSILCPWPQSLLLPQPQLFYVFICSLSSSPNRTWALWG